MSRRQINADELDFLFREIGKSIWYLQYVEEALSTFIALKRDIKTRGSKSAEEAKVILTKHQLNTLGTSLRFSREAGILSPALQSRLEIFKSERDWLVHRLQQSRKDLYEDTTRFALLHRIGEFCVEALSLQKAVTLEMQEFVVSLGVDAAWIEARAQKEISDLRGA